jgi:stearoyl-CoA desaturase (delta-9 desaturase)
MKFNIQYRLFYLLALLSVPISVIIAVQYSMWWWLIASFAWTKVINFVFLQIGLHRYFAHNSFVTGTKRSILLACGSVLTGQGSPISWSTHHLYHHRHSDTTQDLHSPRDGWLHTALLWPLRGENYFANEKSIGLSPKHLVKNSLLTFIHHNYFSIWVVLCILVGTVSWKLLLFGLISPAGWSLLHGNIVTNLISHWKIPGSYQNFNTGDNSWNNKWIQRFQFGEGLHNNHHHNMRSYNQAMMPGEHDPAAWIIDKFFKV